MSGVTRAVRWAQRQPENQWAAGALERQVWDYNVAMGTDVTLDEYVAAVQAAADDVEARVAETHPHMVKLYGEQFPRERAERQRDELHAALAEAGLAVRQD